MNKDKIIASIFFGLSLLFIVALMTNVTFFDWVFARHHNQWSWYIRPIFLIPFCFFSYRRSWSGIAITMFCLFTSMFWFPAPVEVSDDAKFFLRYEKDWLYGKWDYKKALLIATVPVSFFALALACWKRSLLIGLALVVLMATGKITWSVYNAGEAGRSVIVPAIAGLLICTALIFFGFRRLQRKDIHRL
jgi:hypothetical protein